MLPDGTWTIIIFIYLLLFHTSKSQASWSGELSHSQSFQLPQHCKEAGKEGMNEVNISSTLGEVKVKAKLEGT